MQISADFITGVSVGFEIAPPEFNEAVGVKWSFSLDLLIVRLVFLFEE